MLLQYAQRVSTIRNDVSKNENSVELLKLRKQVGGAWAQGWARWRACSSAFCRRLLLLCHRLLLLTWVRVLPRPTAD